MTRRFRAFLSYSNRDAERTLVSIASVLELEGFSVWRDVDTIGLTESWRDLVRQVLPTTDIFVAAVSTHYFDSEECAWELREARGLGLPRRSFCAAGECTQRGTPTRRGDVVVFEHHLPVSLGGRPCKAHVLR